MDSVPHPPTASPGWAEALDESLAERAAGTTTIPGDVIRRDLLDSLARMQAKRANAPERKVTARR